MINAVRFPVPFVRAPVAALVVALVAIGLAGCSVPSADDDRPALRTLPQGSVERSCVVWPEEAGMTDRCTLTYPIPAQDLLTAMQARWDDRGIDASCSLSPEGVSSRGTYDDVQARCTVQELGDWSAEVLVRIVPPQARTSELEGDEGRRALARECCAALEVVRRD